MTDKQLDQLFDKYLLNELSKEEVKQLDIDMLMNPDLEKSFKLRNDIVKGIEVLGNEDLKLVLDKIHFQNIKAKSENKPVNYLRVGLLLLGIVTAIVFVGKMLNKPVVQENMYAEYYEPYIPSLSSRGEAFEQRISDFSKAYSKNNYSRALKIIRPILSESSNEIKLVAGICAMEIENYEESKKLFLEIIESADYYFMDHARWYLALGLLKQNKVEDSKILLKELINDPDADHHSQAQALWNKF